MRKYLLVISILLVLCQPVLATYIEEELFVIENGDGDSQLILIPDEQLPSFTMPNGEEEPGDYIFGEGPFQAFVDVNENFIFISTNGQFKGFDNTGGLIFNLSYGETSVDLDINSNNLQNLYIDSDLNMYLYSINRGFLTVCDYSGFLINRLYPFPEDTTNVIDNFFLNSNNGTICLPLRGFEYTFFNGTFTPGGAPGQLLNNGYYYTAWEADSDSFFIVKFSNPDTTAHSEDKEIISVQVPNETFYSVREIHWGGDGEFLYLLKRGDNYGEDEIWIFDQEYNFIDRIYIEGLNIENPDIIWNGVIPFIASDGRVYEFRCYEDGLHVIRWTKQ